MAFWFAQALAVDQQVGLGIGIGIVVFFVLLAFIKANLVICSPNEVLIISGRQRKRSDGKVFGYRVIKGGRTFKWPILESVKRLPLTNMPIELKISNALCQGLIPIQIDGLANVKISGSIDKGLDSAIERFLGKKLGEVSQVARETIEGSLRGVLASVTPEEANSQRIKLAKEVTEYAREDLQQLGLVLDFFKIKNISDEQGYLQAIGRQKSAQVQKEALIAEATAEAEARIVSAEQKRRGKVAESESKIAIVEAENKLAVHQAQLEAETNRSQEKAKVAGQIAKAQEEEQLEEARVNLNRKRYEADTVIPAQAQKEANELLATGEAAKILENGKATAEAIRLMREHWEDGKTRELFLIQLLPELLDQITRVVADNLHIEKLTVLDGGNGHGLPTYMRNLAGSVTTVLEQLNNATGMDLPDILQSVATEKKSADVPRELP